MKEVLGDLYDKFKDVIKRVYQAVKEFNERLGERGELRIGPEGPEFNLNSYLEDLKGLVEFGQEGIRAEVEGEWYGIPSTYPQFMRDMGWTQKEVLSALDHAIKGEQVTEKQKEIIISALSQAQDMFLNDIRRSEGDFLDFSDQYEELSEESDKIISEFIGQIRVKQPTQVQQERVRARKAEKTTLEAEKELTRLQRLLRDRTAQMWELEDAIKAQNQADEKDRIALNERINRIRARLRSLRTNIKEELIKERTLEDDPILRKALQLAIDAVRKAERAGDKKGVAREKARLKEIATRAKQRKEEQTQRRKLKSSIKKMLSKTKVRKQAGKPVGKFTPEIQETLDLLRKASKAKRTEAEALLQQNIERYAETGEIPPFRDETGRNIVLENQTYSMILGMDTMGIPELQELHDSIKSLIEEGRMLRGLKIFNQQSEAIRLAGEAVDIITGGKGLPEDIATVGVKAATKLVREGETLQQGIQRFFGTIGKTIVGWKDILDMLSRLDKTSKPGESALNQMGDVLEQKNAFKQGSAKTIEQMKKMAYKAFGLDNDHQLIKQFMEDIKEIELGTFLNAKGQEIKLVMSKAEARKRWMELKDPTLEDTFTEGMGYTEEMIQAIKGILTPQDLKFADAQIDFYGKYYEGINKVYRELFGINLPRNELYSPIRREGFAKGEDIGFGEMLQEIHLRASVTSGSLKSRVKNLRTISLQGDIFTLERHIAEMEHFKAWAEKIRTLRAIFNNEEVRQAIKVYHSPKMLGMVDNFLSDFTRGGVELGQSMEAIDRLRGRFARSALAVKPNILIKQLTSFIAYSEAIPVTDFVIGVADFWKAPIENYRFLKQNSILLKHRGQTMERDIKTAMKSDKFNTWRKNQNFLNSLMLNVQIGDQGAIVIGGHALYRYYRNQGLSQEEAIKKFEHFTESTQQSADLSEQSFWQRGGSFAKLFTMFLSAPNQYFRKEMGAIRNLLAGRGTKAQHAKTLAIYHVLIPMFFQWVSDLFTWDEDEQLRAVILGPLNGVFILGDMLDQGIRTALGLQRYANEIAIYGISGDASKAIDVTFDAIRGEDISDEDVYRAIRGLAGAIGGITGIPLKQLVDELKAGSDLLSGEFDKGLAEFLGWSPHIAEEKTKDKGRRR
jgi:hypothetical protein